MARLLHLELLLSIKSSGDIMKHTLGVVVAVVTVVVAAMGQAHASVIFSFTEADGNVLMQSSGVLDTAKLVGKERTGWGSAGLQFGRDEDSSTMGDTTMGGVNTAFGFNDGTDFSPWKGDMFTKNYFSWTSSGTTQFATYAIGRNYLFLPGIVLASDDIVGSLWTPDVAWSTSGTFETAGLTTGVYTITDALTAESISIQIGVNESSDDVVSVAEPASFGIVGFGLACAGMLGAGLSRRKSAA